VADHRHKRVANARRKLPKVVLVSAPLAAAATAAVVAAGVMIGNPMSDSVVADGGSSLSEVTSGASSGSSGASADRAPEASRAQSRAVPSRQDLLRAKAKKAQQVERAATAQAIRKADTRLWATTVLNLWSASGEKAVNLGEIEVGDKVLVTGREAEGRSEIVVDGKSRWVTSGYFAEEKPVAAAAGLSMVPCPDPGVESGLTSDAVYVYRSVCHAFPQITSYGGWDNHGEHSSGKALDIMTSDGELGTAIADFLQAHASELNLYDILWSQQIWTPVRSSEGWRSMPSRGSDTANHNDHVHVSVN